MQRRSDGLGIGSGTVDYGVENVELDCNMQIAFRMSGAVRRRNNNNKKNKQKRKINVQNIQLFKSHTNFMYCTVQFQQCNNNILRFMTTYELHVHCCV